MDSYSSQLNAVPTLDIDGNNWPMFKKRFDIFMRGAGLSGHYTDNDAPVDKYEDVEKKPIKKDAESAEDYKKRLDSVRATHTLSPQCHRAIPNSF